MARPGYTRRNFLRLLGAVGGTGAMLGAMDAWGFSQASAQEAPPQLRGNAGGTRVLILGAGLAGMTAAHELGKLGYDISILEARSFAGGRCQTARRGFELTELGGQTQRCLFDDEEELYINHGPWRIPYHHRSTLHYTKEFGVPLEVVVNDNDAAYILYENIEGPFKNRKVRRGEVKADMRGYSAELLAKAVRQDRLDTELTAEDKELLVTYLVAEGYLDSEDLAYTGTGGRGYSVPPGAGTDPGPGTPSDPFAFKTLLTSGMGNLFRSVSSYSQQATMLEPVGGMDMIAKGFERAVGHLITYNAEVTQLRKNADGVRVTYRDTQTDEEQVVEADYCICTIPLSVLNQIDANFSPEFKTAIGSVAYEPTGKIGLQFNRRFWEEDDTIYGGHTTTDFMGQISYPSYGFNKQKGVLLGYYNFGSTAVQVSSRAPEGRTAYALEQGSKVHPQYAEAFESAFSVAWHLVPYSLGGWANWEDEGLERAYPRLLQPDGRVFLAGEHLSYLTGWQSGAIESAWQQLEKLHQRAQQETAQRAAVGAA